MTPKGLQRPASILAIAAVLSSAGVGGTFAVFSAETQHKTSTFAGGWLGAPTPLTVTPSGYDVQLTWAAATHGLNGQVLQGEARGTTGDCTGATYPTAVASLGAATGSYTDVNRGDGAHGPANGDWYCYEAISVLSGTSWTTAADFPPIHVGLDATGVAIGNGDGNFDPTDFVQITFNQRPQVPGTPRDTHVCIFEKSDVIILGDQTAYCNGTADSYSIARLTGAPISGTHTLSGTGTLTATTTAPWRITVTMGVTSYATQTGTTTLTPSTSIKSYATTDQATICISGANCLPTTTTHF